MKRFLPLCVSSRLIGHFLLAVPLYCLLAWSLLGGEFGLAASIPLLSQDRSRFAPSVLSEPVEIRELAISPPIQSLFVKSRKENNDPVLADVYFDEQRRVIDRPLKSVLFQLTRLLVEEAQWNIQIEGHCDPRGPSAYNFARANIHLAELADYLLQLGIPLHQISTMNYGQDPMPCGETSEQCQEDNLRAEKIFPILSVGYSQRGCLARLRLMNHGNGPDTRQISGNLPSLQRIQVASPSST